MFFIPEICDWLAVPNLFSTKTSVKLKSVSAGEAEFADDFKIGVPLRKISFLLAFK